MEAEQLAHLSAHQDRAEADDSGLEGPTVAHTKVIAEAGQ